MDSTSNRIQWIRIASDIMAVTAIANCVHIYVSGHTFTAPPDLFLLILCFYIFLSLSHRILRTAREMEANSSQRNDNNSIQNRKNRKNIEKIVSKDNGGNIILCLFFLREVPSPSICGCEFTCSTNPVHSVWLCNFWGSEHR